MFKFFRRVLPRSLKNFIITMFKRPFCMNVIYKFIPRLFLLGRFGIWGGNINSSDYWSGIHQREAGASCFRFDHFVADLLTGIDFSNKDVLDVGCGQGVFLSKLSGCKSRTGVDISPAAIKIAQTRGITGLVRELPNLNLDATYDIVCSFETLEHTVFWKQSIVNMIALLRSGGFLIISVPFRDAIISPEHVTYFDTERIYGFLNKRLNVLEIKILGPWIVVVAQKGERDENNINPYFIKK